MILIHDGIVYDNEEKNAVLFLFEDEKVWIPRSLITDYNNTMIEVEDWFAEQEGLEVYEE